MIGQASAAHVNGELAGLYRERLAALMVRLGGVNLQGMSYPHLIHLRSDVLVAKNRLLVVGQQTDGWVDSSGMWSEDAVARSMSEYDEFHLAEPFSPTPFWCGALWLQAGINPDAPARAFAWTNIVKVDHLGNYPPRSISAALGNEFNVLPDEVRLICPSAVLFLTGHPYDDDMRRSFPEVEIREVAGFAPVLLSRVVHATLPECTFRIPHPNRLKWLGKLSLLRDVVALVREVLD